MAIRIIKCLTCQEVLGQLEKPQIAEYDVEKYREMVTCSQGHGAEQIELVPEEEVPQ